VSYATRSVCPRECGCAERTFPLLVSYGR
jgi:hypothetical protein